MGKIHAAKSDRSARLKRLLRALCKKKGKTTKQLQDETGLCAISTSISELRANGHDIICRQIRRGIYEYRRA